MKDCSAGFMMGCCKETGCKNQNAAQSCWLLCFAPLLFPIGCWVYASVSLSKPLPLLLPSVSVEGEDPSDKKNCKLLPSCGLGTRLVHPSLLEEAKSSGAVQQPGKALPRQPAGAPLLCLCHQAAN